MNVETPSKVMVPLMLLAVGLSGCTADNSQSEPVDLQETMPTGGFAFGGLSSVPSSRCEADAGEDQRATVRNDEVVVGSNVTIMESDDRQERWTTWLEVSWGTGPGDLPDDQQIKRVFNDTKGHKDEWEGWLTVSWPRSDFTSGTYKATVDIETTWEDQSWDESGDFVSRCRDSKSVQLTIEVP